MNFEAKCPQRSQRTKQEHVIKLKTGVHCGPEQTAERQTSTPLAWTSFRRRVCYQLGWDDLMMTSLDLGPHILTFPSWIYYLFLFVFIPVYRCTGTGNGRRAHGGIIPYIYWILENSGIAQAHDYCIRGVFYVWARLFCMHVYMVLRVPVPGYRRLRYVRSRTCARLVCHLFYPNSTVFWLVST